MNINAAPQILGRSSQDITPGYMPLSTNVP